MNRTRWIFAALLIALAVAGIYVMNDPQMAARRSEMWRDTALSTQTKDLVMGGIVVLIAGYLGWYLLRRRD